MTPANATRAFLGSESQWSAASLELQDVQALWGGRRIYVTGTGQVSVQLVQPGGRERRYDFALDQPSWRRLLDVLVENDFLTIRPAERLGLPDEARPTITLANSAAEKWTVAKWAGVVDPRFDSIYTVLLQLESLTKTIEPNSGGSHNVGV